MCAGRFEHEAVAAVLLERSVALDPDLGKHIDGCMGRKAFIKDFMGNALDLAHATAVGPWKTL
jgi:hypothetical protein